MENKVTYIRVELIMSGTSTSTTCSSSENEDISDIELEIEKLRKDCDDLDEKFRVMILKHFTGEENVSELRILLEEIKKIKEEDTHSALNYSIELIENILSGHYEQDIM